jgi:VIT1/CCC1 family predicted Fe2+/Mn2+ transporter
MKYQIRVEVKEEKIWDFTYIIEADSSNELAGIIQEIMEGEIGGYVPTEESELESRFTNVKLNSIERVEEEAL